MDEIIAIPLSKDETSPMRVARAVEWTSSRRLDAFLKTEC
jgi:hypothetical protein